MLSCSGKNASAVGKVKDSDTIANQPRRLLDAMSPNSGP
ncbi:hypothetical protein C7S15_8088 [Burkholderia cepacia]|nr:hypothetical protein [Burkholderia cepacia]